MRFRRCQAMSALAGAALLVTVVGALAADGAQAAGEGPQLVDSTPAAGAVLAAAPDELRLEFDRRVNAAGSRLQAVTPTGDLVGLPAEAAGDRALRFPFGEAVGTGRFLLGWTAAGRSAVSTGALVITVDPTGEGAVVVDRAVTGAPGRTAAWRGALVAGGAVLAAAVILVIEARTRRRVRPVVLAAVLAAAVLAALAAFGLSGVAADGTLADLAGADAWRDAFGDPTGRRWLVAVMALAAVPAVLLLEPERRIGRLARPVVAAGLVAVAASAAWSAHGALARGRTAEVVEEVTRGDRRVVVTLAPGRAGPNEAHLYGYGREGEPTDLDAATIEVTHRPTGIGPLEVAVVPVAPSHLIAPTVDLPLAGAWVVDLVPEGADQPSTTLTLEVSP